MTWKDQYRDDKQASGLTWDEYHQRKFVHEDDLEGLAETILTLQEHVEAVENEYKALRRELYEVRVLVESEEFDP